jgi:hypothetical protein
MSVAALRLLFAGAWAAVAVALLARHWLAPPGLGPRLQSRNLDLGGLLAVGFAVWNLARWRQAKTSGGGRLPRTRRRPEPGERNPDFDFGGPGDRSPTR